VLAFHSESYYLTPGFVMTGLGLICFSILTKVGLLAVVWRRKFDLEIEAAPVRAPQLGQRLALGSHGSLLVLVSSRPP